MPKALVLECQVCDEPNRVVIRYSKEASSDGRTFVCEKCGSSHERRHGR